MIELECFFTQADTEILVYQVIQFSPEDSWRVVLDGELMGSLDKFDGNWKQLSGEDFSEELLNSLIKLIEKQHFNQLPLALTSRWNNMIHEVVAKSDQEYLVVCKSGISFKSFEGIFSKFVPGLLKDEWPISFQVFNHDFSDDFTVLAKPTVRKKNMAGWD
ncbi:hypothetical protein EV200_10439 [Pedobacter psychrotolerans]|uniref:Uncharacterized protein n=1 Tax=Pedobacter psychrotolerans TaxID=1843235 RepID=A0A4R2HCP7_9SPHI|nr:hypothetical protein [Pedobacter psychrotolerans]TCO25004.1 hypothetical protein EV200_10439 [Pedobacter psychrotolerans]GGE48840.1 hypothetical protein GCM10011413_13690 [Pedobacter psychrotolerans]